MSKQRINHYIHLVGGEKGGAGKTLFSRTLIQYCLDERFNFQAVEADYSNPDVSNVYKGLCQSAQFSADEKDMRGVDRIFEWALEKLVIVNLPASSHEFVKRWIEVNDLIDLGEQNSVGFVHWFVCSGGYDSVQLFLKSIQEYDSRVLQVLVKNMGLRDEWSGVDNEPNFKKITAERKLFSTIEFPKLAYFERDIIDKKRLRFDVAKQCKDFDFGVVNRQRVHKFLKDAYAQIKQTELFSNEAKMPEVLTEKSGSAKEPPAAGSDNKRGGGAAVLAAPINARKTTTFGNGGTTAELDELYKPQVETVEPVQNGEAIDGEGQLRDVELVTKEGARTADSKPNNEGSMPF